VLNELAQGCTSSAWVCSVLGEHAWFISCFPEQAQNDVWRQDNNACAAASFMPRPVTAVSGGYQVTGTWSFASGCDHAQWFLLGGIGQQPMMMLLPAGEVQIVDDWHVLGLRGTGSKSIRVRDVFVPAHRTLAYQDLIAGTSPGAKVHPDYYLCRTPQQLLAPYSLPAVLLGATQKALDVFANSMRDRRLPNGQLLAEQQAMQIAAAEAGAEIDMIRAMIRHQVRAGIADMRAGRSVSVQESLAGRRDFTHLAHRMVAVVLKLCAMSGSRWVFDGDPMQAILRDVITGSAHRGGSWDGLLGSGRAVLGLPPLGIF
jgi:3-hydroxy-9,10-secoandrosta-1,3,5(10)-triene-9,17-dione monooxygenase